MRVLRTSAGVSLGVTPSREAEWPDLSEAALEAVRNGVHPVPVVWFRTDAGAFGSIPVDPRFAIDFVDVDEPAEFLGAITHFGPDAEPAK